MMARWWASGALRMPEAVQECGETPPGFRIGDEQTKEPGTSWMGERVEREGKVFVGGHSGLHGVVAYWVIET